MIEKYLGSVIKIKNFIRWYNTQQSIFECVLQLCDTISERSSQVPEKPVSQLFARTLPIVECRRDRHLLQEKYRIQDLKTTVEPTLLSKQPCKTHLFLIV